MAMKLLGEHFYFPVLGNCNSGILELKETLI